MLTLSKEVAHHASWMRGIQTAVADEYTNQNMRCPVHLAIGQELFWGIVKTLQLDLKVFSSHRGHLPYLALDGEIDKYIAELHLCKEGVSKGNLGSMHIKSPKKGHITSVPIVGSSIPLAVGAGLAKKTFDTQWIPVAHFGDGACEEGILHESLNMASVKELPVLFVCENNGYSCTTAINDRQPSSEMSRHANNALIKTFWATSTDCDSMLDTVKDAADFVKQEGKPAFLEIKCYRFREHCGPREDVNFGDRTQAEYTDARENDWLTNNLDLNSYNLGYNESMQYIEKYAKAVKERIARGFRK